MPFLERACAITEVARKAAERKQKKMEKEIDNLRQQINAIKENPKKRLELYAPSLYPLH